MRRVVESILWVLSGEFMLSFWPNGGSVVFLRALWISFFVFLAAIGLMERLEPSATWAFDASEFATAVRQHLHWLGAIFGGAYAALYARFASQWTYLANLYNHIMSTQAQAPYDGNEERRRVYANWQAGYIEDAENVHLAKKPIYASVINSMLMKADVEEAFIKHTANGAERLEKLKKQIKRVLEIDERRHENG